MEFLRAFFVFVDRSPISAAKLDGVGGNSRQHCFEIEGGAHRLTDFAERFELTNRACQFVGSLIQFFEQPYILNGDHSLISEGLNKPYLVVRKWLDFAPP